MKKSPFSRAFFGATGRNWTDDLLITSELLYPWATVAKCSVFKTLKQYITIPCACQQFYPKKHRLISGWAKVEPQSPFKKKKSHRRTKKHRPQSVRQMREDKWWRCAKNPFGAANHMVCSPKAKDVLATAAVIAAAATAVVVTAAAANQDD